MDIGSWLEELGLGEYREAFERNAIDREELLDLTDEQLKNDIGISPLGHRTKLRRAIAALRGGAEVPSTAQAAPLPSPIEPDLSQLPSVLALPVHEYFVESDPVLRLWHACDSVELCLRLVVGLGVADLRRSGELPAGLLTELRPRIEEPTLGKWRGMAQAVVRHSARPGAAFPELQGFVEEVLVPLLDGPPGIRTAETSLSSLRNQLAHGGGVTRAAASKLLAAWEERFEAAFARLDWLEDVALVVRYQGSLGVLRGPTTQPQAYQPAEELRRSLQDAFRHGNEVAVVRGDVVAGLWPLALYGSPKSPGEAEASAQTPVPQVFVRRGDVGLQMTPVGSEEVCQSEAGQTELDAFLAFFRVDEGEPEQKEKAFTVPSFEKEIAKESARLVGRSAELAHIREVVESATEGVLWLTGPAGSGKSVLVSRVAIELLESPPEKALVLPYRFRAGDGRCSRESFLRFAIERLESELESDAADEKEKPIDRLKELLSGLGDRRVIFVLDGLDEVAERYARFAEEVPLSLDLPSVIWLCAGRPERGLPEAFSKRRAVQLFADGLPPMSEGDIRTMLLENAGLQRTRLLRNDREQGGQVTNPFVEKVAKCADGLPLYVSYVIGDILGNRLRALDAGEKLPPSLDLYHEELLQRCKLGPLSTVRTPLAGLLTVAREPLGPEALTAVLVRWLGIGTEDDPIGLVRQALSAIGSMLRRSETPEGTEGYTLYHHSLRQHMLASPHLKGTVATARKHLADLALDPEALAPHAAAYLYRSGVSLLLDAGRRVEALRILTSFAYLMGRLRTVRDPTGIEGLLADWRTVAKEPLDATQAIWESFFRERTHILRRGDEHWPSYKILLQLAVEHADDSPITAQADQWLQEGHCDWEWLRSLQRPQSVKQSSCRIVLEGHDQWVSGVLRLKDGRVLSWSHDHTLRIWDVESGVCRAILRGHAEGVLGAVVLPDGEILSWALDKTLRLWSPESGECRTVLSGHPDLINGVLLLSDGNLLSWGDRWLRLWNLRSAECISSIDALDRFDSIAHVMVTSTDAIYYWSKNSELVRRWDPRTRASDGLEQFDFYICGALNLAQNDVLLWSIDDQLRVWNPTNGLSSHGLDCLPAQISAAYPLREDQVLLRSDDGTFSVWDRTTGVGRNVLKGTDLRDAIVLSQKLLLTLSDDCAGNHVWDLTSGLSVADIPELPGLVTDALLLAEDSLLTSSIDGTLRIWTLATDIGDGQDDDHEPAITDALTLPSGGAVSWSVRNPCLDVWDAVTGNCRTRLQGHGGAVFGALVLPTGELLSWSRDMTLRIWDLPSGTCQTVLEGHRAPIDGAMALGGTKVLSWACDRTLRIWSLPSGHLLATLEGHDEAVQKVVVLCGGEVLSWSFGGLIISAAASGERLFFNESSAFKGAMALPNGDALIWRHDSSDLYVWSTASQSLRAPLKGHADLIDGALVLMNGDVVSWSFDKTLRVWDPSSGTCRFVLKGHSDWIDRVSLLSNGDLFSLSRDGTLRVWETHSGTCRLTIYVKKFTLGSAALPDGKVLSWSASDDVQLWDATSGELLLTADRDSLPRASPRLLGQLPREDFLVGTHPVGFLYPGRRGQCAMLWDDALVSVWHATTRIRTFAGSSFALLEDGTFHSLRLLRRNSHYSTEMAHGAPSLVAT